MRRLPPVLSLLAAFALSTVGAAQSTMTVRVLTYNIHHGEGVDGQWDLTRIARVITAARPDLVALQEVDDATERSSGVRQAIELGRLTGLHPAFGEAMPYQGGAYGVAILSKWPMLSVVNRALPGGAGREPRTLLTVKVRPTPDAPVIAFSSTHLDFGRGDFRNEQAIAINQLLAGDDGVSILGGDLNSAEDSDVLRILHERWRELPIPGLTSMDGGARLIYRLDYLLVRPAARWRMVEGHVVDAPNASDHLPVLAVLELAGAN